LVKIHLRSFQSLQHVTRFCMTPFIIKSYHAALSLHILPVHSPPPCPHRGWCPQHHPPSSARRQFSSTVRLSKKLKRELVKINLRAFQSLQHVTYLIESFVLHLHL
jgi:hypothetical protein